VDRVHQEILPTEPEPVRLRSHRSRIDSEIRVYLPLALKSLRFCIADSEPLFPGYETVLVRTMPNGVFTLFDLIPRPHNSGLVSNGIGRTSPRQ
jgi:hypothetical protein